MTSGDGVELVISKSQGLFNGAYLSFVISVFQMFMKWGAVQIKSKSQKGGDWGEKLPPLPSLFLLFPTPQLYYLCASQFTLRRSTLSQHLGLALLQHFHFGLCSLDWNKIKQQSISIFLSAHQTYFIFQCFSFIFKQSTFTATAQDTLYITPQKQPRYGAGWSEHQDFWTSNTGWTFKKCQSQASSLTCSCSALIPEFTRLLRSSQFSSLHAQSSCRLPLVCFSSGNRVVQRQKGKGTKVSIELFPTSQICISYSLASHLLISQAIHQLAIKNLNNAERDQSMVLHKT